MDIVAELNLGQALLARGKVADAQSVAGRVMAARPRLAGAHHLMGQCQWAAGKLDAAEISFRTGLKLERGHAALAIALADLLETTGRAPDAERVLRAALEANRRATSLVARLAHALIAGGKCGEALALTAAAANGPSPDHAVLVEHAAALKALKKPDRALAIYERAASLFPDDPAALHNLAASQGDLAQFAAAAQTAARALKKAAGGAPQTWLVYARALLGDQKFDAADQAFREALARAPTYLEAHRELAQLVWMRTEDPRAATAVLDEAILNHPEMADLFALRAKILEHAGDEANAYATLQQAIRRHPRQAGLHLASAQLAARLAGGVAQGVAHAEHAMSLLPGDHAAQSVLCAACLAAGDIVRASALAGELVARRPLDQRAIAYQATAWRLLGDARYAALYDYATQVRAWRMDTPDGWATLDAYLADLAQALGGVHAFRTHPLDQSVRHGSQAAHLLTSENAVIRAFFQAVNAPIRRHLESLGQGSDPVRARNAGGYRFHGAWSVRLRPGGFHTDHIHPEGWLSSACYIALPPATPADREVKAAWIKFGQPGTPTLPPLDAEHFVEPEPGMLVLFPSYMWHGTVPFAGEDASRLSVAFDLLPQ